VCKPGCRCHQIWGTPHGPNFRLTYKVEGKTLSESLPTPAAIRKAEREVAEFRKFQELSREFVETHTAICRLRPVEEEPETEPEKNGGSNSAGDRARSRSTFTGGLSGSAQDRRIDLEATEMAVRAALHRAGAAALTQLLQFPAPGDEPRTVPCPCGQPALPQLRTKPVLTAVGWAEVSLPTMGAPLCPRRPHLHCPPTARNCAHSMNTHGMLSRGHGACKPCWGQAAPFEQGREQPESSGGLEVREIGGAYGGGPRRGDC